MIVPPEEAVAVPDPVGVTESDPVGITIPDPDEIAVSDSEGIGVSEPDGITVSEPVGEGRSLPVTVGEGTSLPVGMITVPLPEGTGLSIPEVAVPVGTVEPSVDDGTLEGSADGVIVAPDEVPVPSLGLAPDGAGDSTIEDRVVELSSSVEVGIGIIMVPVYLLVLCQKNSKHLQHTR